MFFHLLKLPPIGQKVLFADRDGTLIEDTGYPIDPSAIVLNYRLISLLQAFSSDFSIVIVSNQSGISRGFFSPNSVVNFNLSLVSLLRKYSLNVSAIAFCPHAPSDNCRCRKPSSYMLLKCMEYLNISSEQSFMIGDRSSDYEAGMNAGVQSELINYEQHALRFWLSQ